MRMRTTDWCLGPLLRLTALSRPFDTGSLLRRTGIGSLAAASSLSAVAVAMSDPAQHLSLVQASSESLHHNPMPFNALLIGCLHDDSDGAAFGVLAKSRFV